LRISACPVPRTNLELARAPFRSAEEKEGPGVTLGTELSVTRRALFRNSGFGAMVVLTLALGIGASTAIFSIVHGVLLKPLPYHEPEELYGLWHRAPGAGFPQVEQSATTYTVYRDLAESFVELGLSEGPYFLNLTGIGEPAQVEVTSATASLFHVLGVPAALGRTFDEKEDDPGAPQVAILTHAFWQSRFGGDPEVLGRTIQLNATPWEIVGVMPEGFDYPGGGTAVWTPFVILPEDLGKINFSQEGVGRLKPGVSVEAANAELNGLLRRIPEIYPGEFTPQILDDAGLSAFVSPLKEDVVGDVSRVLWVLFGTVGFVLLIACANVANLFLVRAEGRQRELGLRVALGASRLDLLRHFLWESLVLAGLAGAIGIGIGFLALKTLVAASPETVPRLHEVGLHGPVLVYSIALSVFAGIAFGLIPIVRYRRPNLVRSIHEGSLRTSSGRETHRARAALVVTQVALALVLLIASGLMARSFWALREVDPGFVADHLATLRLALPRSPYATPDDTARFYSTLADRLRALPGVESVGSVRNLPMSGSQSNNGVLIEEFPVAEGELPPVIRTNWAAPGYFETLGIPIHEGRGFERRDHEERTGAVVLSRSLAEKYWPGESAIGKRLTPGLPREVTRWYSVVGIVGDVHDDGLEKPVNPMIYFPVVGFGTENDDWSNRGMTVALRSRLPLPALSGAIRETVRSLDPNLPIINMASGDEHLSRAMARTSYTMTLLAIAAAVALFLGSIGIYAVIAYIVGQRTREIGVRMALGAARGDVARMVVRQGLAMTLFGVVLGVLGALAATRSMSALLYGVAPTDPATFVSVGAFLLVIATLASYLPARRAAGIEPVRALHYD
jgi:predicted permease